MSYSFLVFKVYSGVYAISTGDIYRIERFDRENVEFNGEVPSFYRVGDYVITLDWLTEAAVSKENLFDPDRLILYRTASKIRGIPVTELQKVETLDEVSSYSLLPRFFRRAKVLSWINLFLTSGERIVPVLNLEKLPEHDFRTADAARKKESV